MSIRDGIPSIVVLGGGVAGVAASIRLAEAGCAVTLVDRRPFLGGRASSFIDPASRELLDVSPHVTMGCCTSLADTLSRLGTLDKVRFLRDIPFLSVGGGSSVIRASAGPSPLHLAPSLCRMRYLSVAEKLSLVRVMLAALRAPQGPEMDCQIMRAWLAAVSVHPGTLAKFIDPLLASACNARSPDVSAATGLKVLRDGLLVHRDAYMLGVSSVPLARLFDPATELVLERFNGAVLHPAVARTVRRDGARWLVALHGRPGLAADAVVLAVPPKQAVALAATCDCHLQLPEYEFRPISSVHLWFERAVDAPHAFAQVGAMADWVFNRTANYGSPGSTPGHLQAVISANPEAATCPRETLGMRVAEELFAYLPHARTARLRRTLVLRERRATFVSTPGLDQDRPDTRVAPSLYIAGDWTSTGWPSTMESASRSGERAAQALLADLGMAVPDPVPDLTPSGLARFLGAPRSL